MKREGREKRHARVIKKLKGTKTRPRLVVFRSKKHIYAQLVFDDENKVVTGVSTLSKDFKSKGVKTNNREGAKVLGKIIAEKAKALGVSKVSFDRAGYKYHGRVKALAEGAREGGLDF